MADERMETSKTETARKNEGAHNAFSFPPICAIGLLAKYDPYNKSTLYRRLMLLARAKANRSLVMSSKANQNEKRYQHVECLSDVAVDKSIVRDEAILNGAKYFEIQIPE